MQERFSDWLISDLPPWVLALPLLVLVLAAALVGERLNQRRGAEPSEDEKTQDGYILSATIGLLALLLGFTFALAVDRFDARRTMVVEDANAIRAAFLQAQTFDEPHREQLRSLITRYADNRSALGSSTRREEMARLLASNDLLQRQMWDASLAAVASKRDDVSSTFMGSMTELIQVGAARRAARAAHVPPRVLAVLLIYLIAAATVTGFVMGRRHRSGVFALLSLATMSYLLVVDIDDPTRGGIRESQRPMEELRTLIHPQLSASPRS